MADQIPELCQHVLAHIALHHTVFKSHWHYTIILKRVQFPIVHVIQMDDEFAQIVHFRIAEFASQQTHVQFDHELVEVHGLHEIRLGDVLVDVEGVRL